MKKINIKYFLLIVIFFISIISYLSLIGIETKKEFYTRNLSALNDREAQVVNYLTAQKVDEVKRKRPFMYQFQMGAGLISNFYDIQSNSDIANYQVQTASTTYEFGLYHKIGIRENVLDNGKDR